MSCFFVLFYPCELTFEVYLFLITFIWFFSNQVDLRRAYNCEIMLTKIKIPLPDMIVSSLYHSCAQTLISA